jgi:hypothetical protein
MVRPSNYGQNQTFCSKTDMIWRLLRYVGPAQRHRLDLSEDIFAPPKAQLPPRFQGYARQEPRAGAVLAKATAARTSLPAVSGSRGVLSKQDVTRV